MVENAQVLDVAGLPTEPGPPPRITVLQQSADAPLDLLGAALGDDVRLVRLFRGEPVPAPESVGSGLVVLGGPMNAYDDAAAPWLPATRALIAAAVAADVPTLAVCLGAQLLAASTGGAVAVAPPPGLEAGVIDVQWRQGATSDPVLGAVASAALVAGTRAVSFHSDAVSELPPGATWLGYSQQYPYQAFRVGSALGVQFHPEVTRSTTLGWARSSGEVDLAALDATLTEAGPEVAPLAIAVGRAFAAQVDAYAWR